MAREIFEEGASEKVVERGGSMTTREAGRLGGRRTAETHGKEFYEQIGRKGGETVAREYGPEFYSRIGRKGGRIGGQRVRDGEKSNEEIKNVAAVDEIKNLDGNQPQ